MDIFSFPFIAKVPRGSSMGRGVFLIENKNDLAQYCHQASPAYIQDYLKINRDIRVVIIGSKVVHAYWRITANDRFKTNIADGGSISLETVPQEAIELALHTSRSCRFDDVGIDILPYKGKYYIIEANMKYGREGFKKAGIDYIQLMENMIKEGTI